MSNLKVALLLFSLNPIFLFAQKKTQTIESRLQVTQALIDSTEYKQALIDSRQIFKDYQRESSIKYDSTEAKIYNTLSFVFVITGRADSAIVYANKALDILQHLDEDHNELIKSYNYLGRSYYMLAQFDRAIENLENGLKIVKRKYGEDHFEATTFYGNLSLNYNSKGEPKKAIHVLQKNLDILLDLYEKNHINVAKTYNNFGAVYYNLGDFDKVLDYSFKALKIKQQLLGDDHPTIATSYINVGSMYMEKGDYGKSRTYAEKAISIIRERLSETHPYLTYAHRVIGGSYKQLKSYQKAIEQFEEGIRIIQINHGKNHYRAGGAYHQLGDLYRIMENYEEATKNAMKSLNIFSNLRDTDTKEVAASYELLGIISMDKGEYDKTIQYCNKALSIYGNQSIKGPDRAGPYMNIAIAYSHKNEFPKADHYFNECGNVLQYDFKQPILFDQVADRTVLRELLNQKRKNYKRLYEKSLDKKYLDSIQLNDQHAIALEDYFQSELSEQEARSFHISDVFWRYEGAIKNLLRNKSPDNVNMAFEVAEKSKSRLLTENFRSIEVQKLTGISQDLLEEEREINIDLAFYDKKIYQEQYEKEIPNDSLIKVFNTQLFKINQQKEQLVQTFKEKYPSYHRLKYNYNVVNIHEIRTILQNDQALIEYFVGDSSIFIFVITRDDYHVKTIEKDFPLEEWVKVLRENIYSFWMLAGQSDEIYQNQKSTYTKVAYQLNEKLIAPIQNLLPEKLIVVPDGVLNFIPFEALLTELPEDALDFKSYAYLLKQHQISYNYSATLHRELSNRNNTIDQSSLLAFAPSFEAEDTAYNTLAELRSGFGRLKYNAEEAQAVHSLLGGDLFVGNKATEDQFLQLANQYQVIHLSTHGKSNDQMGDYSFVCFSEIPDSISDNERLYVRELYNMQLNADMVVLSACETGLGEMKRGEGIIGLAHGFTFAGAASTVTSLWSVNDIQTTNLMTRFYKNIKAGMTKDAALRQAKLNYLEEENHADPYFWSGFIAAGNMAPIDLQNDRSRWSFGFIALGLVVFVLLVWKLKDHIL